jgi:hypothetical protein
MAETETDSKGTEDSKGRQQADGTHNTCNALAVIAVQAGKPQSAIELLSEDGVGERCAGVWGRAQFALRKP